MRGDVDTIKARLDIAEVVSGYVKLEKAGSSLKARCPFHSEKTGSFFVSPTRQTYYCFGCGAKGDIFSFVEAVEGLEFKEALKLLADKAGVELEYNTNRQSKGEKEKLFEVLEVATQFFEKGLRDNNEAKKYLLSRGINEKSIEDWRIGYTQADWRELHSHLLGLGYDNALMLKAGLVKIAEGGKEPYDVFRDRIIFPLSDASGHIIAFSGRIMPDSKTEGPKYLNSPDTLLFTKSEVLYGLDRAKNEIRRRNFSVLVEGQMDLVLSHQAGVPNTVATSGTAFTSAHLARLKHLSSRMIIAFDGDDAGEKAVEKSSILGISLGFDVKVADLEDGMDPAELVAKDPEEWKNVLRKALPAIEHFFNRREKKEKDARKLGKHIEKDILPMIKLLSSNIEQSHFVSMLARRTGIKESILWEDLKRVATPTLLTNSSDVASGKHGQNSLDKVGSQLVNKSQREQIEERLVEIGLWRQELPADASKDLSLDKEENELKDNLAAIVFREELGALQLELVAAEAEKDGERIKMLTTKIGEAHKKIGSLEEKKKVL